MSTTRFFCIICGTALRTPVDWKHELLQCHSCSCHVPVPRLVDVKGQVTGCLPVFPVEVLELTVKFRCGKCRKRLRVDARWEGRVVACPVCKTGTEVPRWSTMPVWRHSAEAGEETPPPALRSPIIAEAATLSSEEVDFLSAPASRDPAAAA